MANVIYRGQVHVHQPVTKTATVTGALLPGVAVNLTGDSFAAATTGRGRIYILGEREFYGQTIDTAYVSGDTAIAYEATPDVEFQVRAVAAAYTRGQALTVTAAGEFKAAVAGDVVIAFVDQSAETLAAPGFLDVSIAANSYVVPA
jgi:hypothetical protein